MNKSRYTFTEEKHQKWLKEGRGSGKLRDYKPWVTTADFSSKGRVHRCKGWTTGRMQQLFSDAEHSAYLLYDWSNSVIDIREQYPILPRDTTLEIASDLGVRRQLFCPVRDN